MAPIDNSSLVTEALTSVIRAQVKAGENLCVGLSGGIDSTVLVHAMAQLPSTAQRLRVIHVNHGLHPDAGSWAEDCARFCAALGLECRILAVTIDPAEPGGPEARARRARYQAIAAALAGNEILLTAHQQQDQAETLLLQLLRGAGPTGLSAMPVRRARDGLVIVRPLLDVPPAAIRAYAESHGLRYIDDPGNYEHRFDRNYLRHTVLPRLTARWPAAVEVIARSARLCADTVAAANSASQASLLTMLDGNRLDLRALEGLKQPEQAQVLRAALRELGLPAPSAQQLQLALKGLYESRPDAEFQFTWPGGAMRRYRTTGWLYDAAQNELINMEDEQEYTWETEAVLKLGPLAGSLSAVAASPGPGVLRQPTGPWQVRFRRGGERLRLHAQGPERSLKNLLQENDVVPWMRSHIPIICSGKQVVAVGDLWVNADFQALSDEPGIRIDWQANALIR